MKKTIPTCLVLLLLVLAACQPPGPAALTEADREAIDATTDAFIEAVETQDWAALAAIYTEDAVLMPPNHPAVEGREDIEDFFANFPALSSFNVDNREVEGVGDMAYVRGVYTLTIDTGEGEIEDTGKYLEVRKKQTDGSWLLHVDMFSSDISMEQ